MSEGTPKNKFPKGYKRPKKALKRMTRSEKQEAIKYTLELIRQNISYYTLRKMLMEKYNKSSGAVSDYITEANKLLKETHQDNVEKVRIQFIESYFKDMEAAYEQYEYYKNLPKPLLGQSNFWFNKYIEIKEKIEKYYPSIFVLEDDDKIVNINIHPMSERDDYENG